MRRVLLAVGVVGAALAWIASRSGGGSSALQSVADDVSDVEDDIVGTLTLGPWSPPSRAAPYLEAIYAAEDQQGLPRNLLARVIYQETHYRADIISGQVRSSAGATGIAQLMPDVAAAYKVDPTDPFASIPVAAQELQKTYARFGSWTDAIAAYNWGQGNWNSFLRTGLGANGQARPQENIDYVAQISADVGLA